MTFKQFLRSVCFILIAAVLLLSLTGLLRDHDSTLRSFYSEPDDTISTIVVGSSHVNSSFVPAVLWREYGIAAHNVFSWNQPVWTSYSYIKEALRTQSLSVVVLDLFGMMYGYSYIPAESIDADNYANAFNYRMGPVQYEMMWNSWRYANESPPLADYFNLARYHGRWEYLTADDFTFDYTQYHDIYKGYAIQTTVKPMEAPGWRLATEALAPDARCVKFLDKIVKLAQKEGFELVFTMTPYDFSEPERKVFLWLDQYAAQHGIPLLNYNLTDGERIGFDYSTDMVDWGHTNHSGATKITMDLGRYLAQNYDLPTYEQVSNWVQRDADAFGFGRVEQANVLLTQDDVAQYLTDATTDPWYTAYIVVADAAALSPEMRAALAIAEDEQGQVLRVFNGENKTPARGGTVTAAHGAYTVTASALDGLSLTVGGKEYVAPATKIGVLIVDMLFQEPVDYASVTTDQPEMLVHLEFTTSEREKVRNGQ